MGTVEQEQVAGQELALPPSVQEALGELVNAAKDGLLALSVGVGLGVLSEMMEAEVDEVVGPKGKRNADRTAVRHGHEDGEVTLGGRRVGVSRPRARTVDGENEVGLATYATSLIATRRRGWCWSRCWPASARGASRARVGRSAGRSSTPSARPPDRPFRASSSAGPASIFAR